jgi:hypothetical protein
LANAKTTATFTERPRADLESVLDREVRPCPECAHEGGHQSVVVKSIETVDLTELA